MWSKRVEHSLIEIAPNNFLILGFPFNTSGAQYCQSDSPRIIRQERCSSLPGNLTMPVIGSEHDREVRKSGLFLKRQRRDSTTDHIFVRIMYQLKNMLIGMLSFFSVT